jgi:hypothetical protein
MSPPPASTSAPASASSRTRKRSVAGRVLASFTVTVVAFAVTVGWSVVAQRTTAQRSEELALGYVPVALKLGQLRAAQATVSALVDGINDERRPVSMREVLLALVSARRTKFLETRVPLEQGLASVGSPQGALLAKRLLSELRITEDGLADDHGDLDRLFSAIAAGDKGEADSQALCDTRAPCDAASFRSPARDRRHGQVMGCAKRPIDGPRG